MDVKVAFFNGELNEDIYIDAPTGSDEILSSGEGLKLLRSLYGLKQAPRCWNVQVDALLQQCGYYRCLSDTCIYVKNSATGVAIVGLYVDDLLLFGNDLSELNDLKFRLKNTFEMVDMGDASYCLGLEITRDREARTIKLSQVNGSEKCLRQYRAYESKHRANCVPISPYNDEADHVHDGSGSRYPYREAVGALLYLATCTRPDLCVAVSTHASYSNSPSKQDWKRIMQTMRYLKSTVGAGLQYGGAIDDSKRNLLEVYVDSDHAGDKETRRSRTGYIVMLNGGPISWQSKLQSAVALSSTEAEYYALTDAVQEAIWIRQLMEEIGFKIEDPTPVYEDNKGAKDLANNPMYHKRTRHIDIKYHFVRRYVQRGLVSVVATRSLNQYADFLTKPLNYPELMRQTTRIMVYK